MLGNFEGSIPSQENREGSGGIKLVELIDRKINEEERENGVKIKTSRGNMDLMIHYFSDENGHSNPNQLDSLKVIIDGKTEEVEMLSPHGFIIVEDENGEQVVWEWGHTGNRNAFKGKENDIEGDIITPITKRNKDSVSYEINEIINKGGSKNSGNKEWPNLYYGGDFTLDDIKVFSPEAKKGWVVHPIIVPNGQDKPNWVAIESTDSPK